MVLRKYTIISPSYVPMTFFFSSPPSQFHFILLGFFLFFWLIYSNMCRGSIHKYVVRLGSPFSCYQCASPLATN